jgi:hypothetical protein
MKIIRKNPGKFIFMIIFVVVLLIAIPLSDKSTDYLEVNRTVEKIEIDGGRAYIHFINDTKTYIAYESNGVDFDNLNLIHNGTDAKIKLANSNVTAKYTIIYSLSKDDNVIFDVTHYYDINRYLTSTFFISIPLVMIITLITLIVIKDNKYENSPSNFIIKNPRLHFDILFSFLVFGLTFFLDFSAFYVLSLIPFSVFGIGFVGLFFAVIGGLGVYVYFREKFIFNGEEYKYIKPFTGTKKARLSDIGSVQFSYSNESLFKNVYFMTKDDRVIFSFLDDGTAFKDGYFIKSLENNNIPFSHL